VILADGIEQASLAALLEDGRMRCSTSKSSTPHRVRTPNQTSTGAARRSVSSLREVTRCQSAWMIRAASTASGSGANKGVRKSRVTIVTIQATRFATCVRAPAPSLTADADMLPPAIMPPNRPLTR